MKSKTTSLQEVSPALLEALASKAGEAGRAALANFVKTLIKARFEPGTEVAASTSAPVARGLQQDSENTVNNKIKKGE